MKGKSVEDYIIDNKQAELSPKATRPVFAREEFPREGKRFYTLGDVTTITTSTGPRVGVYIRFLDSDAEDLVPLRDLKGDRQVEGLYVPAKKRFERR